MATSTRAVNEVRRIPSNSVAIVTPIYRLPLTPDEEISIRHLQTHLGRFDRYIIGLESLPAQYADFKLRAFPREHFKSVRAYSKLLLSETFYEAFAEYEYILIYQLDCLVFSADLENWCQAGWDYVGAPWLRNLDLPSEGFSAVGNGGLSLRRVSKAIAALRSTKWVIDDPKLRASQVQRFDGHPRLKRALESWFIVLFRLGYRNNRLWLMREFEKHGWNEDAFWAYYAPKLLDEFKIPSPEEALAFSFEMAPRYCFEQNSCRLPFGCHAWARYDREFWKPYLLA